MGEREVEEERKVEGLEIQQDRRELEEAEAKMRRHRSILVPVQQVCCI